MSAEGAVCCLGAVRTRERNGVGQRACALLHLMQDLLERGVVEVVAGELAGALCGRLEGLKLHTATRC